MKHLIKNFNKKEIVLIIICILLIVAQVWLDLKIPDYMIEITRLVKTEGSQMSAILTQGAYMLICALGSFISAFLVGYLSAYISAAFAKNLRIKVFDKVESFSMEEIKKFSTSSLITRTTNDVGHIQMFFSMGLQVLIKAPITAVWAICKILNKGWQWSLITASGVAVLITVVGILMITVLPKFKIVQKLVDSINNITRETLGGIRVIRAFNAEEYQKNKFDKTNSKLTSTQVFNQRVMGVLSPTIYLVMNLLSLAIYFVGAYLIDAASMMDKVTLFSNMVVFSSYAMQVIMSFLMLALIFIMYPRASVSADRINEILMTKVKIKSGRHTKPTKIKGEVEFKNVSFKYPDSEEYVLRNISFKASKGDTIAFIGSTGSGKSTLINLVPRFYDATEGEVLIDGINVKNYQLETLYEKVGYVPQSAVLFSGTVNYNVSYGSGNIDQNKIEEALKVAQANDFVIKMPKKYESDIAQRGVNLSGGQKQRMSIARAVAKNPEIYIFDDSFSALDYKTDYLLRKDLKKYTKEATSLIVAQRIGTIKDADKIIVLEAGKCVGIGKHNELLKKCKVYQEIAYSQLSKEELEHA